MDFYFDGNDGTMICSKDYILGDGCMLKIYFGEMEPFNIEILNSQKVVYSVEGYMMEVLRNL